MKTKMPIILLSCWAMLLWAGCAGGGDGGNLGGENGSCTDYSTSGDECVDYNGSGWDATTATFHCTGMGGTYSSDSCTADGRVGRCSINDGDTLEYTHNYYDRAVEAQNACNLNVGVWTAD